MADPMRMIVVGLGRGKSHIRNLTAMQEQFELVGVVDLNAELLNTVLEEFSLPQSLGYTSFDEALVRTHPAMALSSQLGPALTSRWLSSLCWRTNICWWRNRLCWSWSRPNAC